jgi:hypothetical protein
MSVPIFFSRLPLWVPFSCVGQAQYFCLIGGRAQYIVGPTLPTFKLKLGHLEKGKEQSENRGSILDLEV